MDDEVHQMVAKDIKPSEIVVEGKGEVREGPSGLRVDISDPVFQLVESEGFDLDVRVLENVGFIIKLEGNVEGVGIRNEGNSGYQANSQKVFLRKRTAAFC